MIILSGNDPKYNQGEVENSPRRRVLEDWYIVEIPANNPDIKIYQLEGWTTKEADGYTPPARITRTSPIAACEGNKITTASGSTYWLGTPATKQTIHSNQQFITGDHLNPWIDGQNWLTI